MQTYPICLVTSVDLDTSATFMNLADDTVAFIRALDQSTNAGTTVTAADVPFMVTEKITNGVNYSDRKTVPIYGSDIVKVWSKEYTAPVAQITYAGFDPTTNTGTLAYDCDTDYGIKVIVDSPYVSKFYNTRGLTKTAHIRTECCVDCDAGCATGDALLETAKMVQAFNSGDLNFNKFVGAEIVCDILVADTVAVWTDSSTMTLTNGSPFVTTSAANTLAVGDYIRVSGTATVQPADTDPVYKVKTIISTTRFELETPWQNATVTRTLDTTLADSDVTLVTKASVTQAGIKFTGKFLSLSDGCCCFPPFPFDFDGCTFIVTDSDTVSFPCDALTVTTPTTYVAGHGTAKEVLQDEMNFLGYTDVPEFFNDCASNGKYSLVKETNTTVPLTYRAFYVKFRKSIPIAARGNIRSDVDYVLTVWQSTTLVDGTTPLAATVMDTMWTSIASLAGVTYENNA